MTDLTTPADTPIDMGAQPRGYAFLRRCVDALDNVLVFFGCLMLFALMCVVVADVGLRYFFNAPLQWSYQVISTYLMPGLFFLAVSHTLKAHAHVSVDILHNFVRPRTRFIFETFSTLVALPAFAIATWVSIGTTYGEYVASEVSTSGLAVPSWTVSIFMPVGFALLTLRLALNALGYLGTLITGRELIELPPISGTETEGAE